MTGWTTHSGVAVVLNRENIDTDQLIPARFMSTPRSEGYGAFLLHDLRKDSAGQPVADFPLNRVPGASVLIAGRNFGSGSSREAAVYALVDFGIRAVVAPSFGDIFASNAVNNGLLPARVDAEKLEVLLHRFNDGAVPVRVDLANRTLALGDTPLVFDLDEVWRRKLINGWDDIDLTRQHHREIAVFRDRRKDTAPWAFPERPDDLRSAGRETGSQQ